MPAIDKIFEITTTIYSKSESSEQFLKDEREYIYIGKLQVFTPIICSAPAVGCIFLLVATAKRFSLV